MERLRVRYSIGGSVASSVYGEVRTTLAVDFVTDLDPERIDAFVAAVESDFHVVAEAIHRAVRERSSFNLIHKLRWYDMGGRFSDRQWRDVLGVLKVQGARLDLAYMERAAATLGLSELLDRARSEAS